MARTFLAALLFLPGFWACASEPAGSPDGSPAGDRDASGPAAGADASPGSPDAGTAGAWSFRDVAGVPNLDDDDGGGQTDWAQAPFPGDDDLSTFVLPGPALDALPSGDRIELSLAGDTDSIRLYREGELVLGAGAGSGVYAFDPPGGEVSFTVEFGDYAASGTLTVADLDGGGAEVRSDEVSLRAAPLIMNHHLQPAEHLWAVRVNGNSAFIDAYQSTFGSDFTEVNGPDYGYDVWIQDEFEFATLTGDEGQRMDVVIDSIRDRGLDDYDEDALVGPGTIAQTWGQSWQATSYDSFGNLEASPPVTVNGVDYPFGRIYYGREGSEGLNGTLGDFLASQEAQAPFELPTTWLCVGHVDEFSSFVPDPSSPKGFKLLLTSTAQGWQLLQSLPGDTQLPHYARDHGYATVADLLADDSLHGLNADIQTDYLDPIRDSFKQNLGLEDSDIIEIPGLFETVSGCGGGVAALVPGMVNLIVANVDGQTTHLFIPDPFFRPDDDQPSEDPFLTTFADRMPEDLELHFVDNWDVYHMGLGEVHCGSNVMRTPTGGWWMQDSPGATDED